MKKHVFVGFIFALALTPSIQALSLKERAQKVSTQALALAKRGGAQWKKLWHKIDFMGNSIKALEKAQKELISCLKEHCQDVARLEKYNKNNSFAYCQTQACFSCRNQHCSEQFDLWQKANEKVAWSIIALEAILIGAISVPVLGTAAYLNREDRPLGDVVTPMQTEKEEAAKPAQPPLDPPTYEETFGHQGKPLEPPFYEFYAPRAPEKSLPPVTSHYHSKWRPTVPPPYAHPTSETILEMSQQYQE